MIRLEIPADRRETENLTREAFGNVYRPECTEHFVLHTLRNDPAFVPELDYIMEEDGRIVAHIVYAKGTLNTESGPGICCCSGRSAYCRSARAKAMAGS